MYSFCVIGFICLFYVACVNGYIALKPCVNNTENTSLCLCTEYLTDCSRKKLTFIPKIPPQTKVLNMSGNLLRSIDNITLSNISNIPITSLDLSKNRINEIENGSFSVLPNLRTLNISLNSFAYQKIVNLSYNISKMLSTLILEGLRIQHFPYGMIPYLNKTNIFHLSLKHNGLKNVKGQKVFPYLTNLKHLDLSFNFIHDMQLSYSERLDSLSLSSNDLSELPYFCTNGSAMFPHLGAVFLDDNCISALNMQRMNCLSDLKLLNISATKVQVIPRNSFSEFKSLLVLTLEWTQSLTYIDDYAFNSSSIRKVYIRSNHVIFKQRNVKTKTFLRLCPQLENLDLSGNVMSMLTEKDWEEIFKHIPKLTYLDIGFSNIMFLPQAIPKYLHNLESLHVASTDVHYIPPGFFKPLVNLKTLIMNNDKLTTLSVIDLPPSFTNHLKFINFAYNPFVCNCELLWFIQFAEQNKSRMEHYPDRYQCSKSVPHWKRINDSHINQKACMLNKQTEEIIKCTCYATIFLLLTLSIIYRYRWRLRYMLHVLKFHRRNPGVNGIPYIHDVYISSADFDFRIVYYQIVMELEMKGLNVFFPERDALPGTYKVRESLEHMDRSKYVILCLSNAYTQDNRCEFETCMALERSIYENNDNSILIVILLEEIDALNVTRVVHKLLRTGDYLKWDESPESSALFWIKLQELLNC